MWLFPCRAAGFTRHCSPWKNNSKPIVKWSHLHHVFPWINRDHFKSPVSFTLPWPYQALFKSFRLPSPVPPQHPLSLYPFHKSSGPSFFFPPSILSLAPSPSPTHCNFSLALSRYPTLSLSPSASLDPSPHPSPSLRSLSSAQLPVELDVVQEQADGSVIRSASLHSLSTSPC